MELCSPSEGFGRTNTFGSTMTEIMHANRSSSLQLEEMAMIPPRDLKDLLYAMFNERYVAVTEVAKTADHAPSRTFYCFNVPIEQLAKQLLDQNYKSILNLMAKRFQILSENR